MEKQKFEINGKTFEADCERVDLHTPRFEALLEGASSYIKVAEVQAVQVTTEREVNTLLDATTNTAKPGDWIVTNPGGEQYVNTNEYFQSHYLATDREGIFNPIGEPILAVQVNENLVCTAPWKSDQAVLAGGFMIARPDGQRYFCEENAFFTTYKKLES